MALYRSRAFQFGRCVVKLMSASCRTRQKFVSLPALVRRNWVSLSITGGLCAVPFTQEEVTHESLIRRASSLVTDSTNTYLSQTTLALVDSLTQYTKAINSLITLHQHYVASVGRLNPADEEAVWQVIVRQRQEVMKRKEKCKEFETKWMMANNLSELASEAAFNAGADQASALAQTSLQTSQSQVEEARQRSLKAERALHDSKAATSKRPQRAVTEDEEIPEAYLRED